VQHELAQLSGSIRHQLPANPAMPQRLYYPANAAGLEAVVRSGTLRALDWRLGCEEALVRYGIEVVEAFLGQRQGATADPLREQFRSETLANFHPRGTHFDGFVARLFERAGATEPAFFPGYALGLSVANLPIRTSANAPGTSMRLFKAIYSREQQLAIVQTIYQACEDYFVSTVHRFGEQNRSQLLTPCWDKFRRDIGTVLMQFRNPASFQEREWIAIALTRPHQEEDPVVFEVVGNRLVPSVALDIGWPPGAGSRKLPLDVIAIGPSLQFESTREALSAFLSRNRVHGVSIVRAPSVAT
jgi:hypothetical protein